VKKTYNKLVRDRIPEIIQAAGKQCAIETMDEAEFHQALRAKLVEEAQEAAVADPIELVTEFADLCEVMDTLMAAYDIDRQAVLVEQKRRQVERGGFSRRIRLLWSGAD
jgi:predicted house-cleaning noncanonical NTP pyrophosphatase (MazG superfamily)